MDVKQKNVTVVGLGVSGYAAAVLLDRLGAKVFVTDDGSTDAVKEHAEVLRSYGVEVEIGGHTKAAVRSSELIVVSPGVENSSSAMRWAGEAKLPVISEMELGFCFSKGRVLAVTGTNGKSTVVSLVGSMLRLSGIDAITCGNIGNPLSGEVDRMNKDTWAVLEVSSFQLERIRSFRPDIAVVLNITDDHLDRYRDFKEYYEAKTKVFLNQTGNDTLILNHDAINVRLLKERSSSRVLFYSSKERVKGSFLEDGIVRSVFGARDLRLLEKRQIPLKGTHNLENVLAASCAALVAGAGADGIRRAIEEFRGLDHRLQSVSSIHGVEFIDDSKSTTVDSTARALEWCSGPVILIAGGKDKRSDYAAALGSLSGNCKAIVLIGETKEKLKEIFSSVVPCHFADSLEDAVVKSFGMAKRGDRILLSPMCSSFDMFSDYKHRAAVFRKAVRELKNRVEISGL
ncbi:MAG: UDP-N-acetylmuramoyl-L-alanine--D-glutamate ligase [Candidatus Omnitrophota bacterium]